MFKIVIFLIYVGCFACSLNIFIGNSPTSLNECDGTYEKPYKTLP